jgi:hypothetical protein
MSEPFLCPLLAHPVRDEHSSSITDPGGNSMSVDSPLNIARHFAGTNVAILSTEVLAWRKSGRIAEGHRLHELAALCIPVADEGDEYQTAEGMVIQCALAQASYVDALHAALSKYASRGLSVTLSEDELAGIDALVSQRQHGAAIDLSSVHGRVGALVSQIKGALRDTRGQPGKPAV